MVVIRSDDASNPKALLSITTDSCLPTSHKVHLRCGIPVSHAHCSQCDYKGAPPQYTPALQESLSPGPISDPIEATADEGGSRARSRFAIAILYAAGIYVLFALFGGSKVTMPQVIFLAGPADEDGHPISCFPGGGSLRAPSPGSLKLEPPYSTSVWYSIPTSSDLVYFLSRGDLGQGSLHFELSTNQGNNIEIAVVIVYSDEDTLQQSQVCLLERDGDGHGVGFFTPRQTNLTENIYFDVTVRFPRRNATDPLLIKTLQTNMGMWTHQIDRLGGLVKFDSLSFNGSVSRMHVSDLSVRTASLVSGVGHISGKFEVSERLRLSTSQSPITAEVHLRNSDSKKPTTLNIATSSGMIDAKVSLLSPATGLQSSNMSSFAVNAETTLAPLRLAFPAAPTNPFSKLNLKTKTIMGTIDIKLHTTYEGHVVQTSKGFSSKMPRFNQIRWARDPSGKGRPRKTSHRTKGHTLETETRWGNGTDELENFGNVEVMTVLGQNVVTVG